MFGAAKVSSTESCPLQSCEQLIGSNFDLACRPDLENTPASSMLMRHMFVSRTGRLTSRFGRRVSVSVDVYAFARERPDLVVDFPVMASGSAL